MATTKRWEVLASAWFNEFSRYAYGTAWRVLDRALALAGRELPPDEREELVQDGVSRGFDILCRKAGRVLRDDRRLAVGRAVRDGMRRTLRAAGRFGNDSPDVAIRDDAMRSHRIDRRVSVHGTDSEREYLDPAYVDVPPAVTQADVRELLPALSIPEEYHDVVVLTTMGVGQEATAMLCHYFAKDGKTPCTRKVRAKLAKVRNLLDPAPNAYALLCHALEESRKDHAWVSAA